MCNAATAVMAGIAVLTAGMGMAGSAHQAEIQYAMQKRMYEAQAQYAQMQYEYQVQFQEVQHEFQKQQAEAAIAYQEKMHEHNTALFGQQMDIYEAMMERDIDIANKMNTQQTAMFMENVENAHIAFADDMEALNARFMEEEEAASQDMTEITRQRMEKVGEAMASSENAGMSLDFLINSYYRDEAVYKNAVGRNLDITRQQIERGKKSAYSTAQNRIASFQFTPAIPQQRTPPIFQGSPGQPVAMPLNTPVVPPMGMTPTKSPVNYMSGAASALGGVGNAFANYFKNSPTTTTTKSYSVPSSNSSVWNNWNLY